MKFEVRFWINEEWSEVLSPTGPKYCVEVRWGEVRARQALGGVVGGKRVEAHEAFRVLSRWVGDWFENALGQVGAEDGRGLLRDSWDLH